MDASGLDANERCISKFTVLFHQLVSQTIECQSELERVDQKVLWAHDRLQK